MNSRHSVEGQICVTLDVDWAKDEIVQPVIERMRKAGVKATIFATHRSSALLELDDHQFEVGIHPNFNRSSGDFVGPTEELKAIYPRARGGRSHSLFSSSSILQGYMQNGLIYESNLFLPMHESLHPVIRFKGLVSIPIYWCDDTYFSQNDSFNLEELRLDTAGLKVLNFHPIHVFMNTSGEAHYLTYREYYQEPDKLRDFINAERGVGTLFQSLLDYLAEGGRQTFTLSEIHNEYISEEARVASKRQAR